MIATSATIGAATPVTCALEGCEAPVVRRAGGGRPRLYCSDRHRAEARRRRVAGRAAPEGDEPLTHARRLLRDALSRLDQAATGDDARNGAQLAALRAETTAQVLEAQQLAADATRRAEAYWTQLEHERAEWETARRTLLEDRARATDALHELTGSLDGARDELERELVRHHGDVEELTRRLHAQTAACTAVTSKAEDLRRALADRDTALENATRRATSAEAEARRNDNARRGLEVRMARTEEQGKHAAARVRQLEADLKQSRQDLVAERRQRGRIVSELRRQLGGNPPAPPRRPPRRGTTVS